MKSMTQYIANKVLVLTAIFGLTVVANAQQFEATGGDAFYAVDVEGVPYFVHVFTNTGTANFNVTSGGQVDVLVVGGGGGGGQTIAGGGGGGGVMYTNSLAVTSGVYTVTVGDGGLGSTWGSGSDHPAGLKGGDTSFATLTALGGAGGAGYNTDATDTGGSGGGDGASGGTGGGYTAGQGHPGGSGLDGDFGGGGGGAGSAGTNAVSGFAGGGGAGLPFDISGTNRYYAGGGGGGVRSSSDGVGGGGGIGGGGAGSNTIGTNGEANSGGGGGGAGWQGSSFHDAGDGGSGIVIIRYVADVGYVPFIEVFSLANIATGSAEFTNSNEVEVTAFPVPEGYTEYQITESGDVSSVGGSWFSTNMPPTIEAFDLPAADTNVTLYSWFTNTSAAVALSRGQGYIYYTTAAPTAPAPETLSSGRLADQPVVIAPDDLDLGASGGEADGRALAIFARRVLCAGEPSCDETPAEPYLTLAGTQPDGDYPLKLWVQNEAGNATLSSTTLVTVVTAATNTWTGAGATDLWDDDQNWSAGEPVAGQHVRLEAGADALLANSTPELASFILTGGTLTFSNWTTRLRADMVDLQASAELTLPAAFSETQMSNRVWIVCSNFTMGADAAVNVDGKGYLGSQGPGGAINGTRQGGGSYGGRGGYGGFGVAVPAYGSVYAPVSPGSGGGYGVLYGGAGGGAVRIQASGSVAIHGEISANGQDYISGDAGGGSGGAIFIECQEFDASAGGLLQASGGDGRTNTAGGGGGGRISVTYDSITGEPSIRFATLPGIGVYDSAVATRGWHLLAQWGTVSIPDETLVGTAPVAGRFDRVHLYFKDRDAWSVDSLTITGNRLVLGKPGLSLTVTNDLTVGANAEFGMGEVFGDSNSVVTVGNDLKVTDGGIFSVYAGLASDDLGDFGARVGVSNELFVGASSWVHPYSHRMEGGSVHFAADTLTVESGGGFDALGRGFGYLQGPGAGSSSVSSRARGGGHGGRGGACSLHVRGGMTNGSVERPMLPGSGGGFYRGSLPDGGGLIYIEAGTASISGQLKAVGAAGTGGGAGGGIVVDCDTLFGQSPEFIADGGNGDSTSFGGGGGGRIALHYNGISGLVSPYFSTAAGTGGTTGLQGVNWWTTAGEGTVWCSTPALLSDTLTGERFNQVRFHANAFQSWTVSGLTVSNGLFSFGEDGFALNVLGDLVVASDGVFGLGPISGDAQPSLACGGDLVVQQDGELRVYGGRTNGVDTGLGASIDIEGDLRIETNGWVKPFANQYDGGSPRFRARSLQVAPGGGFKAAGVGYWTGGGPGAGGAASGGGGGGGYGGAGGIGYRSASPGKTNGLALAPFGAGSGGGQETTNGMGGNGGGLVWLELLSLCRLEGLIDARGNNGRSSAGGGSGGGILLSASRFAMGPGAELRADGGDSGKDRDGDGGGGRIALWREVHAQHRELLLSGATEIMGLAITEEPFSGLEGVTASVNPGNYGNPADPGTIRFVDGRPKGTMILLR